MHKLKSEVLNLFWSQKKKSENKRNTKDGVTLMLGSTFLRTFNFISKTMVFTCRRPSTYAQSTPKVENT